MIKKYILYLGTMASFLEPTIFKLQGNEMFAPMSKAELPYVNSICTSSDQHHWEK